jgi:ribosomal protein S18 acetylase RimI-like enzyme
MDIVEAKAYSEQVRTALNALLPQLTPYAPALTESALQRIISAEDTHLLLAVEQGRICGAAAVVIINVPSGKRARIEDLVVSETMRGRGIGRQLITYAIQLARKEQVGSIDLTSHPSRLSAKALYQAMGFSRRETNTFTYSAKL